MEILDRWRTLLREADAVPLDEAALLISASANPQIDVATQLDRLDRLAGEIPSAHPSAVTNLVFSQLRIRGNRRHYDDPRNSYLDQVIDRGLGIPISIAVLLIEVGRRAGLELDPIGMPGHFLVADRSRPDLFIDPFDGGRELDISGCEILFRRIAGSGTRFDPAMLQPTSRTATLARMLINLDRSFAQRNDQRSLLWVRQLRAAIPDQAPGTRLELAQQLEELGDYRHASHLYRELSTNPTCEPELRDSLAQRSVSVLAQLN